MAYFMLPSLKSSDPNYRIANDDVRTILHKYVGMGDLNAAAARSRFEYFIAKIEDSSASPEPPGAISDRKIGKRKLERIAEELNGRVTSLEATNPTLDRFLDGLEEMGQEMMRIAINGEYSHQYDPGNLPLPIRAARAGYFGRKLFAYMVLAEEIKNWQNDAETGKYNPIRNMFDLVEAQTKLSKYQEELNQLMAITPIAYPPSDMSAVEKSFVPSLHIPLSRRLASLFGASN